MNIQLTPAKIVALLKTLVAWAGLIVAVTNSIPSLHAVRPVILACSSILLTIEHGIYKMGSSSNTPTQSSNGGQQ